MVNMVQRFFTFDTKVSTAETREETLFGRKYLVVPVIALVQGVIQASNSPTPELALASEFARVPESWNGRPIMLGHPKDDNGNPISANSPGVLAKSQMGFMFQTRLDNNEAGKPSLKTEAWLDIDRCKTAGGNIAKAFERVEEKQLIEVSTGLYSTPMPEMGTFDSKKYENVWREVIPDHLAFLEEGTIGACSIADGCGAMRTNDASEASETSETSTSLSTKIKLPKSKKSMRYNAQGYELRANCDCDVAPAKPNVNELTRLSRFVANSYPDQMVDQDVRTLLDLAVCETFEGYCSLLMFSRDQLIFVWYDMDSWQSATYQVPFNLDDSGKVTFTGPATEVALLTKIVEVQDSETSSLITNEGTQNMSNAQNTPASTTPAVVTETPAVITPAVTTPAETTPVVAASATPATPAVTSIPAARVLTAQEYIDQAPAGVKEMLQEGMRIQQNRKDSLVANLKANANNSFSEVELKEMSLPMLERLTKLATPATPTFNGRAIAADPSNVGNPALIENEQRAPKPLRAFENGNRTPATSTTATPAVMTH